MSKNPKIEGIVFRYGDDDYSFWMPDISKDENEKFVQTLFAAFEDNGCSVRGTKKDIIRAPPNIQKHEPQLSGKRISYRKASSCNARNSEFQRWGSNKIQRH